MVFASLRRSLQAIARDVAAAGASSGAGGVCVMMCPAPSPSAVDQGGGADRRWRGTRYRITP